VTTTSDPAEDLREAGVVTTSRGGGTRLSFHLTNTGDDADRVAAVLRSHVPT
jgi:selenocysteine lyase/cysteine desulfurase